MNEPTTENIEAMISFLADKTLSFGCKIKHSGMDSMDDIDFDGGIIVNVICDENWCEFILHNGESVHGEDLNCVGEIIGHPVMIGDVLCKMDFAFNWDTLGDWSKIIKLIRLWFPLRLNKSLNEVLGGEREPQRRAGVCQYCCSDEITPHKGYCPKHINEQFKNSSAQDLWELLVELFPNYKQ